MTSFDSSANLQIGHSAFKSSAIKSLTIGSGVRIIDALAFSEIADLAHCSSRPDALIAAQFLSNFIPKDSKWVHLDIAGVGFIEHDGLFAYKGATGFGVRGLYRLLLSN
jgi:leucyl aminopeptidase